MHSYRYLFSGLNDLKIYHSCRQCDRRVERKQRQRVAGAAAGRAVVHSEHVTLLLLEPVQQSDTSQALHNGAPASVASPAASLSISCAFGRLGQLAVSLPRASRLPHRRRRRSRRRTCIRRQLLLRLCVLHYCQFVCSFFGTN